jgi:hypothetical protein
MVTSLDNLEKIVTGSDETSASNSATAIRFVELFKANE